jgi:uncharacterized protein YdaU (DUF1376 family)
VFRGDVCVQSMKAIERWMYMSLLHQCFYYTTRPYLPDDDRMLWRLAGCDDPQQWIENKDEVLSMFYKTEIDGVKLLAHKRVIEDYERVMNKRQEMHDRAVRGGRVSAQARGQAQVEPKLNSSSTPAEPNPTKRSEVKGSEVLQDQRRAPAGTATRRRTHDCDGCSVLPEQGIYGGDKAGPPVFQVGLPQRRAPDSDLHPTQYAAKLMEAIGMPHTMANMRVVAAAVTAEGVSGGHL